MRPGDIKHFLITLDPATGTTEVQEFGTDEKTHSSYFKSASDLLAARR